jgi:hypothetical protein
MLWLFSLGVLGVYDIVAASADPSRRARHDRVAGTLVVRDR